MANRDTNTNTKSGFYCLIQVVLESHTPPAARNRCICLCSARIGLIGFDANEPVDIVI